MLVLFKRAVDESLAELWRAKPAFSLLFEELVLFVCNILPRWVGERRFRSYQFSFIENIIPILVIAECNTELKKMKMSIANAFFVVTRYLCFGCHVGFMILTFK